MARRKKHEEEAENDERWLLTYADMMTLLVALFMVLFSISSVNKSKYESLQRSLKDAFSGRVLPGGKGIKEAGGTASDTRVLAPPLTTTIEPAAGGRNARGRTDNTAEMRQFRTAKRRIDAYARTHGISGQVNVRIARDGLHVRLLTDKLLFASGSATPQPDSVGLLRAVGGALHTVAQHPVIVEGHTDNVPVRGTFPSNWELSGARASAVVRMLSTDGLNPRRMTAAGRADQSPIASNATPGGRALNRRVEILIPR